MAEKLLGICEGVSIFRGGALLRIRIFLELNDVGVIKPSQAFWN